MASNAPLKISRQDVKVVESLIKRRTAWRTQTTTCLCGCGTSIPAFTSTGKPRTWAMGHHLRKPANRQRVDRIRVMSTEKEAQALRNKAAQKQMTVAAYIRGCIYYAETARGETSCITL